MEDEKSFATRSISFLDDLSNSVEELNLPQILKTYYMVKCRKNELKEGVKLPSKIVDPGLRCPKCCILHYDNKASYKVETLKKLNRFQRRLLRKKEKGEPLTKFQQKCAKTIETGNKKVITCGICGHKSSKLMKKPQKTSTVEIVKLTPITQKKKKKKDRSSGLNLEVVGNIISNKRSLNTSHTKNVETFKSVPTNKSKIEPKIENKSAFKNSMQKRQKERLDKHLTISNNEKKKKQSKVKFNKFNNLLNETSSPKTPSNHLKKFLQSI